MAVRGGSPAPANRAAHFASPKHALAQMAGDLEAVSEARRIARLIDRTGTPVYLYSFEREADGVDQGGQSTYHPSRGSSAKLGPVASVSISISRRLFTTHEFRNMIEAGVLQGDDRLELVDGEIVEMSPIGNRHAACVRKLNFLLRSVGDRALVDVKNPLGISGDNNFYPDVVLLRPRADNYGGEIPGARDALLVIEVADTTLQFDRSIKKPRYAAAGVPELWIVDLEGSRVWVHRKPLEGDYGEVFEAHSGDVLKVPGIPDVEIPVADLVS